MFARSDAHLTPWGLRHAPVDAHQARQVEQRWRWPTVLALALTIPAFYAQLTQAQPLPVAHVAYGFAALMLGLGLLHTAWRTGQAAQHLRGNAMDVLLVAGLLVAAVLPPSHGSAVVLSLRLLVAFGTLLRMVWAMQHLITRGSLPYMLVVAGLVLGLCGVGYWWLEPTTPTLAEGLWLAFVTASTVGYGDYMPTTPAAKLFSVFVVMLGFGVLSLVTAAIATRWIETEERIIEREILRDVHRQMATLQHEIAALRADLGRLRAAVPAADAPEPPR